MSGGPRNFGATPILNREGHYKKPINAVDDWPKRSDWHKGFDAFDRLNYHHTLASARRYVHYKPIVGLIPKDSLDVSLSAAFDQGTSLFPDAIDVALKPTTTGADTRRRLRNIVELPKAFDAIGAAMEIAEYNESLKYSGGVAPAYNLAGHKSPMAKWQYPRHLYGRYDKSHVLYVTGIKERRNINNVKLMNSSHHSPQTNGGYSRQDNDGSFFQY